MAAATQPRRRRRKNITTTELPQDVIFNNILPRLPARYVKNFLLVSKQWSSFLKSTMFANMHLNHATNDDHQNHHKLVVLYENEMTHTLSYSNRDCETQKPGMRRRLPLPFEHISRDMWITSSCNGLVLVSLSNSRDYMLSHLIIWNPLTNDYKSLSKTDLNIVVDYETTRFKLYYKSSEQDYRVLLITDEKVVYVYSLKSDSWRKINFENVPNWTPPLSCLPSTYWDEKLFFKKLFPTSITMFDTKTEKFTNISIGTIQDTWFSRSVIVQRGCLHMCIKHVFPTNYPYERCIKLWSLDRSGVWENTSTYTWVQGTAEYLFMEPLHLMRDGHWLMKPEDWRKCYYKVDLENKHNEGGPR